MVDQGGGLHAYQKIAGDIRDMIRRGELRADQKIPPLNQLTKDYKVSYATAQTAVKLLVSWGMVRAEQGTGTFVLPGKPVIDIMTSILETGTGAAAYSWRDTAAEFGVAGSQTITGAGVAPAPADVADALGYDAEAPVAWRERNIMANGDVIQIATSYFATEVFEAVPELGRPERLPVWSYELMARAGWVVVGTRDLVIARFATASEAQTLGLAPVSPVSELLRSGWDAAEKVIMVERNVSNSDRIRQLWISKR